LQRPSAVSWINSSGIDAPTLRLAVAPSGDVVQWDSGRSHRASLDRPPCLCS